MRCVAALALLALAHGHVCDRRTLPDTYVNDDYCDCADGSDEPGTGACEKVGLTCPSKPHTPKVVFASRVNDGVCDCCDGADEPTSGASCPNTCVEEAKVGLASLEKSLQAKVARSRAAREASTKRVADLAAARATLDGGARALDEARAARAAAEEAEAARREAREARLASGEVARALRLGELSPALLGVALARLALEQEDKVASVDGLHDALLLSKIASLSAEMEEVDGGHFYIGRRTVLHRA
jgi:protein kinase C substrate 80K-H